MEGRVVTSSVKNGGGGVATTVPLVSCPFARDVEVYLSTFVAASASSLARPLVL
jgi:hypothetical protein